jgi:hypothetical protein
MITTDTINVVDVLYRWKDDEEEEVSAARIVVAPKEELDYIFNKLEDGDEEWTSFDGNIFFYINSDDESIDDLYDVDFPSEFLLVKA